MPAIQFGDALGWMPGTSPGMTEKRSGYVHRFDSF